jgi:hypothetical protein
VPRARVREYQDQRLAVNRYAHSVTQALLIALAVVGALAILAVFAMGLGCCGMMGGGMMGSGMMAGGMSLMLLLGVIILVGVIALVLFIARRC